tara:strand:+ start:1022 stop:3079 length:2058 start_codon:yes stop_codon:yes gene_type:complete
MDSSKKKLFNILFLLLTLNFEYLFAENIKLDRGKALYESHCADCHSVSLRGSAHGNELVGKIFLEKWKNNYKYLYSTITETMPPGDNHKISEYEYFEILAYILNKNDIENVNLTEIVNISKDENWVSFSDPSTIDRPEDRKSFFENKKLNKFINLTLKDINYPNANDWTSWRRTPLSHGYTPLNIINKKNVSNLKLSWSLTMAEGSNQGTPLVYNGVMFLTHPDNIIQAINAKNGNLIWEYKYNYKKGSKTLGGPTRNIAIFKNKIFLATYDAHLIALDAISGELLWKTKKANYEDGYTHTSGPVIADGIVVSGINGCERYVKDGCFITGHDPETGKELWRTSTIALSGDPNSKSWGDTPELFRAGSDMWIAGSYDPELKLFYIGTSQAKPWVAVSRGMTPNEAALYTNSTLALNPKTGEIVWYFQHIPGETIDMEVGFERILINENDQKFLITIGKDGIVWKLNRKNGAFIKLKETIKQDIYSDIDYKYGIVKYRDDIVNSEIDKAFSACPGIYGGHNWQSASYDNNSNIIVIPLHQLCSDMIGRKVDMSEGGGGYGGDSKTYKMPNKKPGKIVAINSKNLNEIWSHEQEALFLTSALTTKSGLTFIGDLDRKFKAFDTLNGELLWETTLNSAVHGYPISFGINNKQYIAVTTGMGVFRALTSNLSPEIYQPEGGNTLYVFELD